MIEHIREERTGSKRRKAARRKTARRVSAKKGKTKVISMPGGGKRYMVDGKFASKAKYDSARKGTARKGALTRRRKKMGQAMIANPRSYKMGYAKGVKDYRSSSPSPASQIRSKSMDYQVGYLEGYSDSASKRRPAKSNPKRRRRNGAHGDTKKGRMSNGRMWYMVDGKFTTKAKYDRATR